MKNEDGILNVSEDIQLPLNAVTQRLAFLGTIGSGKSYGATKLAEEMSAAGAQFIALDPVGIWYGLRSAGDGQKPGLSIPVFGGLHGDVPLEHTGGTLLADLIVDNHLSCVIDVSQFEHDTHKARFAYDFGRRLFFRKKSSPSAMHIFMEEAEEFLPQEPEAGEQNMVHEFKRIWKLGRNFGIGGSLISQRPQELVKKALNLTEGLFCFQMTGIHERRAVDAWVSDKGLDQNITHDLPKLEIGTCHFWSPRWLKKSEVIKISRKWTYDASSTPKVGAERRKTKMAEIDLEKIAAAMKETIEKAKFEDPKELQKQVRELEHNLRVKTAELAREKEKKPAAPAPKLEEIPFFSDKERSAFDAVAMKVGDICQKTTESIDKVLGKLEAIRLEAMKRGRNELHRFQAPKLVPIVPQVAARLENGFTDYRGAVAPSEGMPKGAVEILNAVAQNPEGCTDAQIAILTGYRETSRKVYKAKLKSAGLIDAGGRGTVITQAGIDFLGDRLVVLPKGPALREHWLRNLTGGQLALFKAFVSVFPQTLTTEQIMQETGYKETSVKVYRAQLAAMNLVEDHRAHPNLFE